MTAIEPHPKLDVALKSIQPIRDLARNWDVDIAACLEDYLEEFSQLEQISQQTQLDHPEEDFLSPNFAQAAILLHQSSNVYSRKVEYLYTLVYAALNNLVLSAASKSNNNNGKSPPKKRVDAEIAEFEEFDQQINFLLLDDVLPTDEEGKKINLSALANNNNPTALNLDASLENETRLSLGGSGFDQTKTSTSQYHHQQQQTAILSTLVGSDGGLGILQNTGSQNGVFYMRGTASSQPQSEQQQNQRRASSFGGDNMMNLSGAAADSPMQEQLDTHDDDAGAGYDNYDDGDDDDHMEGVGFQLADEPDAEPPQPTPVLQQLPLKTEKTKSDPWDLLDPHDAEMTKVRPLRMGTTFALPPGLDPLGPGKATTKQKRRRVSEPIVDAPPVCIATATFKATMAHEHRRRERLSMSAFDISARDDSVVSTSMVAPIVVPITKGLAFGEEFAYIAKANNRRKAAERRERRKLLLAKPSAVPQQEADQLLGYEDNQYDFGGDNDDDSFGDDNEGGAGFEVFDDGINCSISGNDTSNLDGTAFEALCRAHIQAFARGAEKYKAESNLTKRVGDWQSRLAPVLEEEAQRPEFDIHKYGAHVIDRIQKEKGSIKGSTKTKTEIVEFHSVTRDKKPYDVCRLFLASLSLSNSGNVRFTAPEGTVMTPDTLKIELLNPDVDRPMEHFLAPSALEDDFN